MTTSLEAKNKLGFVDGTIGKPPEDDLYYRIWCRCNSMIKSWLLNSVTKQIYTRILYFKNASDIWNDLRTRYHKSSLPRLYKLRHQLHSFRQGSLNLSSYHTKTQSMWEELSNIQVTNHTVEDLLAERETNHIIDFLMRLNDNYENIRSRILMRRLFLLSLRFTTFLIRKIVRCNQFSADATVSAALQVSQHSPHINTVPTSDGLSTGYQRKD